MMLLTTNKNLIKLEFLNRSCSVVEKKIAARSVMFSYTDVYSAADYLANDGILSPEIRNLNKNYLQSPSATVNGDVASSIVENPEYFDSTALPCVNFSRDGSGIVSILFADPSSAGKLESRPLRLRSQSTESEAASNSSDHDYCNEYDRLNQKRSSATAVNNTHAAHGIVATNAVVRCTIAESSL